MKNKFILIAILSILSLVISSCASEEETSGPLPKASPKPAKTQKAAEKVQKDIDQEPEQEYVYIVAGKRDPFESPLRQGGFASEEVDVPLTPLQKYETVQLKLTGVVIGMGAPKAMVKAPDGKAYILNIGTLVGKNGGKVVGINNEGVLVEEVLRDFSGETRVNSVLIALPKRKGV